MGLTSYTFKEHLLIPKQSPFQVKTTVVYNHALWMTRQWILTHEKPPKLRSMINQTIKHFKGKFACLKKKKKKKQKNHWRKRRSWRERRPRRCGHRCHIY